MIWLALAVAVVVAVLTVAAVLGRVDGSLADATTTMSHVPLPEDRLSPADLDTLRFDTALRGYRMSQVDAVLDRLRGEIGALEDELAGARAPQAHRPGAAERPPAPGSAEHPHEQGSAEHPHEAGSAGHLYQPPSAEHPYEPGETA